MTDIALGEMAFDFFFFFFFFNDTLITFYLQLYGVRHMVKDHSNSERGNLLLFFMHHPRDRISHMAFVTQDMEHWLE